MWGGMPHPLTSHPLPHTFLTPLPSLTKKNRLTKVKRLPGNLNQLAEAITAHKGSGWHRPLSAGLCCP